MRADSGFAREWLMAWCEAHGADYAFGLARNDHLAPEIEWLMERARLEHERMGQAARRFKDFQGMTRKSWSRRRRVVGKTEWTQGEANPRFIVTSLGRAELEAHHLYGGRKIIVAPDGKPVLPDRSDAAASTLTKALLRASRWQMLLDDGVYGTIAEIADNERINRSYLSRTIRLSLLTPDIVEAILNGTQPSTLRLADLESPFPIERAEQRIHLGVPTTPVISERHP